MTSQNPMRELLDQERDERWQLYRNFKVQVDTYREGMDDVVGDHKQELVNLLMGSVTVRTDEGPTSSYNPLG